MLLKEPKTIVYRNKFLFFFIFDLRAIHNDGRLRGCSETDISFAISVSHIKLRLPFDMALDELFVYSIYRFLARNKIKEIEPGSFDGLEESLIIL